METQLKSLIEKYCLNSNLTDNQLDEIIDLGLATKANPKEVEEYIQEKTEERKAQEAKEEAERKAQKAKEEAERKAQEAKEEAERKAQEEADCKANEERIKQKVEEFSGIARKRAAQLLNDNIITEMGTIDARATAKAYKRQLHEEAMDAYKHRKDSPEAAEYNRVLWEEYDKIFKAVLSCQVKTMEDLIKDVLENHKE